MTINIDPTKPIQQIFIEPSELPSLGIRYSNSHRLKLESEKLFPQRRYLSPQKPVYIVSELSDWIEKRFLKRGGGHNG